MYRLQILFRLVMIWLFISSPCVLVGCAIFGIKGVAIGFGLAGLWVFVGAFGAEYGMIRSCSNVVQTPAGLKRSLELSVDTGAQHRLPRVVIYADPFPHVLLARSFLGSGTIIMSQGIIAMFSGKELQVLLELCERSLRRPGITFQSCCSLLAFMVLRNAPRTWVKLFYSRVSGVGLKKVSVSPISGIGFVVLYPIARLIYSIGKLPRTSKVANTFDERHLKILYKLDQFERLWRVERTELLSLFSLEPIRPSS